MNKKRIFDFIISIIFLILMFPILIILVIVIYLFQGAPIFYRQNRVGKHKKLFKIYKFRTMILNEGKNNTITIGGDPRVTPLGKFLRKWKLDELPSLLNILIGEMSIVGPRPDVPGFADKLEGDYKRVLSVKPGITCLSTLKYSNEEELLRNVDDPKAYNKIIFEDKTKLNLYYIDNWSFLLDLKIIFKTIIRSNY